MIAEKEIGNIITEENKANMRTRDAMLSLMSLSTLYAFMYCMLVSKALVAMPIFGGALFMSGRVAVIFSQTFAGESRNFLSPRMRKLGTLLLIVVLILNLCLLAIYPVALDNPAVWILFAIIFCIIVRGILYKRILRKYVRGGLPRRKFLLIGAICQGVPAVFLMILLVLTQPWVYALQIYGGYVLNAVLEAYTMWKEKDSLKASGPLPPREDLQATARQLQNVKAFTAYQSMYTIILIALQVTLVMMYSFIAFAVTDILLCMFISFVCTFVAREITDLFLKRTARRDPDPTYMLIVGLCLWLVGLVLFYQRVIGGTQSISIYFSLVLCSSGATVCVTCLAGMERIMAGVAEFSTGEKPLGYWRMRSVGNELAMLIGQMLALGLLTVLCFVHSDKMADGSQMEALASGFRPLLVIPALILVLGAILSVFQFPLSKKHLYKLQRFLELKESGEENAYLQKELETVVIKKHKRRYGAKILIGIIRPFYRHKLLGKENVPQGQDGRLVFICNHGELYGPVVTNLYMPFYFRPWSISDIMGSKENVAEYLYTFTIKRQRWLPEFLKWPIARLLAPLSIWLLNSIEAIPVYRNKPRELMNTFKISVEAMQAEDNLLIFPETGAKEEGAEMGYVRQGAGEFFTGFTMVAPIYYNKTGRNAIFIPIYASQDKRTITIGKGTEYDPDNQPTEEKLRIVDYLRDTMNDIARAQGDIE